MATQDVLEGLGLSPGEARVYQALLHLGSVTVGPIARDSQVSRSKIYEVLDKLIAKGLASVVFKGKHKFFLASKPVFLLDIIKQKQKRLEVEEEAVTKLIPQLIETQGKKKRTVELFEGINGLKTAREELLFSMNKGEELLVLGAPRIANELLEGWFIDFHKRREKRGIHMRIVYNANNRAYGEKRKKWKLTTVRYLPENFVTPTWFDVSKDNILLIVTTKGEKPYALLVRDCSVADSVRSYFELLWKMSVK